MEDSTPPWLALHLNMAEMIKALKAAHKSVLGFHWKKIPPLHLIFPQVDHIRVERIMDMACEEAAKQQAAARRLQKAAETNPGDSDLRDYYTAMIPYLDEFVATCQAMKAIAHTRHMRLEKKKVPVKQAYAKALEYEQAHQRMRERGAQAYLAWNNLEPSRQALHP